MSRLRQRVNLSECGELTEKTVTISRVAKVVKGGRRFSFSALVVTGDKRGHIGVGLGKAAEVPDAIRKATEQARKSLIRIPIKGTTIPHDIIGKFGPSSVVLKPAAPGTGIIAGSAARAIIEVSGIKDIRTKCIGPNNSHNILHAIIEGFLSLKDPNAVAEARGMSLEQVEYHPY